MKFLKQRNAALFSVLLLLLSLLPFSAFGYAEERQVALQITNATLETEVGEVISEKQPVNAGMPLTVKLNWQLPQDSFVENGMQAVFSLPKELKFADSTGALAEDMGTYQVKEQVLTMTFAQNYQTAMSETGSLEADVMDYQGRITLAAKVAEAKVGSQAVVFAEGVQPVLYYEATTQTTVTSDEVVKETDTTTTTETTKASVATLESTTETSTEETTAGQISETTTSSTESQTTRSSSKNEAKASKRNGMARSTELSSMYNIIKNLKVLNKEGEITAENPLVDPSYVELQFDWLLENRWTVNPGDTYTLQLPSIFELHNAVPQTALKVVGDEKTVYGYFSVTKAGLLAITFAEGIDSVDERAGKINLVSTIDKSLITGEQEIRESIKVSDDMDIQIVIPTDAPDISKSGSVDKDGNIVWSIEFNSERKNLSNVVLTESLPAGTVRSYHSLYYNSNPDVNGIPTWKFLNTANRDAVGKQLENNVWQLIFGDNLAVISDHIKLVLHTKTNDKTLENYSNKVNISGSNFLDNQASAEVSLDQADYYKHLKGYDLTTGIMSWEVKVAYTNKEATKNNFTDYTYKEDASADTAMHYFVEESFAVKKAGETISPAISFSKDGTTAAASQPTFVTISNLEAGTYVINYKTQTKIVPIIPGTTITNFASNGSSQIGGDFILKPNEPADATGIGVDKYSGKNINYNDNTISWKAEINTAKVAISNLVITDLFQSETGSIFPEKLKEDSLKLYTKDANETETVLVKGADYDIEILAPIETWGDKGFKVVLKGAYATTSETLYMDYQTIFNAIKYQELFPYSTIIGNYLSIGYGLADGSSHYEADYATDSIWNYYKRNGGKSGTFIEKGSPVYNSAYTYGEKGSTDTVANDMIYWSILLNTYGQSLPVDTLITDTPAADTHVLDKESYMIYSVTYNGDRISLGTQWKINEDYQVTTDGAIKLLKATDQAFVIFVKTDVKEMTSSYTNNVKLSYPGSSGYDFSATVKRQEENQWLTKSGKQVTADNQNTSSVAWQVVINQRARRLENAVITDTIDYSKQTFKKDANGKIVTVREASVSGSTVTLKDEVDASAYEVVVTDDFTVGTQTMTVTFKDTITKTYAVIYETVLNEYFSGTQKVSNNVSLTGEEVGAITKTEEVEVKYTTGSGTSSGKTSSLTIAKVADDKEQTALKASFLLYRAKSDDPSQPEAEPVFDTPFEVDGLGTIQNLRSGNYFLREVAGPAGYQFDTEKYYPVEVTLKEDAAEAKADITIVNRELMDIAGEKMWANEDEASKRPEKINVSLVAGASRETGTPVADSQQIVEPTKAGQWLYQWTDLRKYDDEGKEIKYWVVEDAVENYKTSYTGYDITNTWDLYTIEGRKTWDHGFNPVANQPTEIKVSLVYGEKRDSQDAIVIPNSEQTITADDNWIYQWQLSLTDYPDASKVWVVETAVPGYDTEYIGNTDITNTRNPDLYTIQGTKTWEHGNNAEANYPTEINVWLVYGENRETGEMIPYSTQVITADSEGKWIYTWEINPDVYPEADQVWIVEETVDGYLTSYDEGSYDVTNAWIEPEVPTEEPAPSEPTDSTEPSLPTEPIDSTEPSSSTEPSETTESSSSTESSTTTASETTTSSSIVRPTLPDTQASSSEKQADSSRKQLPKTGETSRDFFSILGVLILTLVATFYWKRRNVEKG